MSIDSNPEILIQNTELLLTGTYTREGFDLLITGYDGTVEVVVDYFAFDPPPNLMMPDGGGLSPEMVNDLLRTRVGEVQLAQEGDPAEVTTPAKKVGEVWFLRGDVYRVPKDAVDGTRYKLAKGSDVFEGDKIIVDGIGYFRAQMIDGTRFSLGKLAQAVLSAVSYTHLTLPTKRIV